MFKNELINKRDTASQKCNFESTKMVSSANTVRLTETIDSLVQT